MPKRQSKMGQTQRTSHAQVSWCVEDIQTMRPEWSEEQCNKFLMDNEDDIQCASL